MAAYVSASMSPLIDGPPGGIAPITKSNSCLVVRDPQVSRNRLPESGGASGVPPRSGIWHLAQVRL